ncbi:PREDICTED: uncharacterized protein LOC109223945 isoform X1 [Nicotiana attenuata]|nr:PREDICTED: uncharacterized protein LOC109223945 isoform X1 [Nicotiana attenuata]XP_019244111.1 PREDICTED: uncharacterized protein LOC109223945 isoform X1 [Nicotiana attenuata]
MEKRTVVRNMAELLSMAMADDDDMKDASVSPLDLNSIGGNESEDVLSPEDIAWADSCLIKDLAISDHGMDSSKHVSPDAFPSQKIFSAVSRDDSPQESRIFPTVEETGISGMVDDTIDDVSPTNEQEENTTRHLINNKDTDSSWSRINSENDFPPTYNEDLRLVEDSHSEVDSEFSTFVEENLADIFKVWELDIPDEEDELVKQFNKALAGSSFDSTPSEAENLGVLLDDKLLDDIISGLDDLSLSPING